MKVKCVKSFVGFVGENSVAASEGQVLEMPTGADWIRAGLAVAMPGEKEEPAAKRAAETTAVQPPEDAALPKGKPRDAVMSTGDLKPGKKGK